MNSFSNKILVDFCTGKQKHKNLVECDFAKTKLLFYSVYISSGLANVVTGNFIST